MNVATTEPVDTAVLDFFENGTFIKSKAVQPLLRSTVMPHFAGLKFFGAGNG